MLALSMEYSSDRKGVCSFGTILFMFKKVYPVYQRFFSRAAEIFVVGRRSKPGTQGKGRSLTIFLRSVHELPLVLSIISATDDHCIGSIHCYGKCLLYFFQVTYSLFAEVH